MHGSENPLILSGDAIECEDAFIDKVQHEHYPRNYLHVLIFKSIMCSFYGNHELGAKLALERGDAYLKKNGTVLVMSDFFHQGISLFAMSRKTKKRKYIKRANKINATIKSWAKKGNPNVNHFIMFLLQFGIPYWTRTDERTAQLHYLTGKILGRGRMSSRRYLSVKSTAVIPIAQRLRMTADDTADTSLDDVFRRISDLECVDEIYQEEEGKLLKEKKSDNLPEDKQTELERSVKLQVFQSVCKMVKSDLLLNHMRATLDGPEQLFQFRRSFTTQLAANSLMQYVFAVVERTPSKFIFNVQNGRVLAPDFRFAYNKQGRKCAGTQRKYSSIHLLLICMDVASLLLLFFTGFLEGNEMPFRLTRNIRKLIGPLLIDGIFIPSMMSMASSMSDSSDDLESALNLLLRDDIVSWYHSRSNARSDSKTQEIERQLGDRIVRNCSLVRGRYAHCSPNPDSGRSETAPIDTKVRSLVAVATSSELLCRMPLNYQGWL
jgi:phosphatidylinositol kinase/protein kinase (PI-3  family)